MKAIETDKHKSSVPHELRLQLCNLLSEKLGLFFSPKNWQELEKKIDLVAKEFGFKGIDAFIEWLLQASLTQVQVSLLAQYLTIGETYFFRDPQSFLILEKQILPELIAVRNRENRHFLRIWSVGCCTGEETYSIAILLHRLIPDLKDWDITLLGADINLLFIKRAEEGSYKKWSFRGISPEIQKRYFINEKETYSIIPEIKKMVKFKYFNLADDSPLNSIDAATEVDLILCNNVLIYFSPKQIQKAIQRLSSLLKEGGWLLVTSIEAPFINTPQLLPCKFNQTTIFKKETSKMISKGGVAEVAISPKKPPALALNFKDNSQRHISIYMDAEYEMLLELYRKKRYSGLISELERRLIPIRNNEAELENLKKEILLLVHAYANQRNSVEALEWCNKLLEIEKFNPQLHYLKATIFQELNSFEAAINSLKMALYLDSSFIPAYFALGNIEMHLGRMDEAVKHLQRALELLNTVHSDEVLPGMEGITARQLIEIIMTNPYLESGQKK